MWSFRPVWATSETLPQNSKDEKETLIVRLAKFESRDGMPSERLLEFWWKAEVVPGRDGQNTGEKTGKGFSGWQEAPRPLTCCGEPVHQGQVGGPLS